MLSQWIRPPDNSPGQLFSKDSVQTLQRRNRAVCGYFNPAEVTLCTCRRHRRSGFRQVGRPTPGFARGPGVSQSAGPSVPKHEGPGQAGASRRPHGAMRAWGRGLPSRRSRQSASLGDLLRATLPQREMRASDRRPGVSPSPAPWCLSCPFSLRGKQAPPTIRIL